ncbi:MAG: hypothetical protein L7F77_06185 [Candidatus Magnetominusculus sp. LBB02]|nr:hypothetical protein [Candidatus Magnetominusculus sp. LBB02]
MRHRIFSVVIGICLLCSIYGIRQVEASSLTLNKMTESEIQGYSQNSGMVFSIVISDAIRMDLRFGDVVVTMEKSLSSDDGFYLIGSSSNNGGIVKLTADNYQVLRNMLSEMSVYGDTNNLNRAFLSILNLLVSWPATMPVYASIDKSAINTLTSEYKQQSHSVLISLSNYKPRSLCNAFGKKLDFFWPVKLSGATTSTPDQSGTIGQNGCFGRCGAGCSSDSSTTYNNIYTYACARHDACVGYSGTLSPGCDYLFAATISDYTIGLLGIYYNGTQYNCSSTGS